MEWLNNATCRSRTRIRTAGRSIDRRDKAQNNFASAFAATFRRRVCDVSAVLAIDGDINRDADETIDRAKHFDLAHEFPPLDFRFSTQLAGR